MDRISRMHADIFTSIEKWDRLNEYESHFLIKSGGSCIHRNVCGNSFVSQ